MTRAEAAAILVRLYVEEPVENAAHPFTDIPAGHWIVTMGNNYLAQAFEAGLVRGINDTTFAPDQSITREEFAAMVVRAQAVVQDDDVLLEAPADGTGFADNAFVSGWAIDYVYTVRYHDWMIGSLNNNFNPLYNLERAQGTAVIVRIEGRDNVDSTSFVDVGDDLILFDDVGGPLSAQWFYYYVISATNSRTFVMEDDVEVWTAVID